MGLIASLRNGWDSYRSVKRLNNSLMGHARTHMGAKRHLYNSKKSPDEQLMKAKYDERIARNELLVNRALYEFAINQFNQSLLVKVPWFKNRIDYPNNSGEWLPQAREAYMLNQGITQKNGKYNFRDEEPDERESFALEVLSYMDKRIAKLKPNDAPQDIVAQLPLVRPQGNLDLERRLNEEVVAPIEEDTRDVFPGTETIGDKVRKRKPANPANISRAAKIYSRFVKASHSKSRDKPATFDDFLNEIGQNYMSKPIMYDGGRMSHDERVWEILKDRGFEGIIKNKSDAYEALKMAHAKKFVTLDRWDKNLVNNYDVTNFITERYKKTHPITGKPYTNQQVIIDVMEEFKIAMSESTMLRYAKGAYLKELQKAPLQ